MIVTAASLDALRITFDTVYREAYGRAAAWADAITTKRPSNAKENVYGWLAQQIKLREWIGPRQSIALAERSYRVPNRKFEATVEVDRVAIEDDNLDVYASQIFPQLGEAVRKFPDQLLRDILQSNPEAFDGETLFSDSHPTFDSAGSVYDNNFGIALSAENFNTVWSAMAAYTGEDGEPLGLMPNLLIVPPQLRRTAAEIVGATAVVKVYGDETGSDNVAAASTVNVMQGWADVLVVPELANEGTTWYLAVTNKALKPFVYQERTPPELAMRTQPDDPKVFELDQFTWGVRMRAEMAPTLPFLIAKSKP